MYAICVCRAVCSQGRLCLFRERCFPGEICRGIVEIGKILAHLKGLARRKRFQIDFRSCEKEAQRNAKGNSSVGYALPTHERMRSLWEDLMVFEAGSRSKT